MLVHRRCKGWRVVKNGGERKCEGLPSWVIWYPLISRSTSPNQLYLYWDPSFTPIFHWGPLQLLKGAELNCEIDYTISFWSWMLSWKSPHFVKISTFRGYYLHFVERSAERGYYPHFVDIYVFCGYYQHFVEISMFRRYYPHLVEISTSRGYYPHFVGISAFYGYYPHFRIIPHWPHHELLSS